MGDMVAENEKSIANKALAKELDVLRHRRGMTIRALAEKAMMPVNTLSLVLKGTRNVNFTQLALLAAALDESPEKIIGRAFEEIGGLEAVVAERRGNVTPLRKKPEDMTDEELDTLLEDEPYAAHASTPEAEADEQF